MRYYNIVLTSATTGKQIKRWTSIINGTVDPGAHQVEIDVLTAPYAAPLGDSHVTIWGPSRQDIAQTSNFNGADIVVSGGMSKGLPLANPAQQGVLVKGQVFQCYANWLGVEQTLEFRVKPSGNVTIGHPANIVLEWRAGTTLASALATTLSRAFPNFPQQINISPNLVLQHDECGAYATLEELGHVIQSMTFQSLGASYAGVEIILDNGKFLVLDGTVTTPPIQFLFTDLVGQPTWREPYTMQVTTVMRGDIRVGDYVKLPVGFVPGPGSIITAPESKSQFTATSIFQGTAFVRGARHVGNFRDPNGTAWVSIFDCAFGNPAGAASNG